MRLKDFAFLASAVIGVAFLVQLGFWQLNRLEWKLQLIADMEAAVEGKAPVLTLAEAQARFAADGSLDYLPVEVSGMYQPETRYLYAIVDGKPGWHAVNPVQTADASLVLVNRGAIPEEMRGKVPVSGPVELRGFARRPQAGPGWFQPPSAPEKGLFYWRDTKAMAGGADAFAFIVEAQPVAGQPAQWPRPEKADPKSLTNNHMSYAITWFSLAGVLGLMTGIFIVTRRNSSTAQADA
jgi:surfeit locus 1 family protein